MNLQLSNASRILGMMAAAVLAGGLAACSTSGPSAHPVAAAPASAPAVPVRVQSSTVGWSGMVQRPHRIYVGMGGAPVVRQLAWRNWGRPRASATGKLDVYWPQPGPISGWHPTTYPVTVQLQDILSHNGQPSYRKMAYSYVNRRGVAKVLDFTFYVLPGGSVPAWNPPGAAQHSSDGVTISVAVHTSRECNRPCLLPGAVQPGGQSVILLKAVTPRRSSAGRQLHAPAARWA